MLNAISVDVEEYFQVSGLEQAFDRKSWEAIPSRLNVGLSQILDILECHNVRATFFFLGWIADHHPQVVTEVAERGHEIAVHGYWHRLIDDQGPAAFEEDLNRALEAIRNVYDGPVLGYRAPSFSIGEHTRWALDSIKAAGLKYDASIIPFVRRHYGIADFPQTPCQLDNGLWEFPMTTISVLGKVIPIGGGGYLRLYPLMLTEWALRRLNVTGRPAVVYVHPWELDPSQPRVKANAGNTFRHYVNLDTTADKLDKLCQRFEFAPLREVLPL